jgi:hypothetical protein
MSIQDGVKIGPEELPNLEVDHVRVAIIKRTLSQYSRPATLVHPAI